jgi:hypothetical protein
MTGYWREIEMEGTLESKLVIDDTYDAYHYLKTLWVKMMEHRSEDLTE